MKYTYCFILPYLQKILGTPLPFIGMALMLILGTAIQPALAQFSGSGQGTEEDPYIITNIEELQEIKNQPSLHYRLANDIDASETSDWNDGKGFEPIGFTGMFSGSLDGDGHIVTNLTINLKGQSNIGLFRDLTPDAKISQIGLENISVIGASNVGGLAGVNYGEITSSYVTGRIEGNSGVGGLVATNLGEINSSYTASSVSGSGTVVGGFVGTHNSGSITNSYAIGTVTNRTNHVSTGGFTGNPSAPIQNSFWDTETSGQSGSAGGEGKTTAEMLQEGTFEDWDFDDNWSINEGESYPWLQWQESAGGHNMPPPVNLSGQFVNNDIQLDWDAPVGGTPDGYNVYWDGEHIDMVSYTEYNDVMAEDGVYTFYVTAVFGGEESNPTVKEAVFIGDGDGSEGDPYQILTTNQLQGMQYFLSSHFILAIDIDAADTGNWNNGEGFEPIGDRANRFTGSLDGDGHVITNLFINRPATTYVGLFGLIDRDAKVMNIGLEDVAITAGAQVGGLAGVNFGEVTSSYATGGVEGLNAVGGLVGVNDNAVIKSSYAMSYVAAASNGGGLVGENLFGSEITDSYSTGRITGSGESIGGLVGNNNESDVINSYWNTETSIQSSSNGGESKTTAEMLEETTFDGWDFGGTWSISDGETYPWLQWQGSAGDHNDPPETIPPVNFTANFSNGKVLLNWDAPSAATPDGYKVYRDDVLLTDDVLTTIEYTDEDAVNQGSMALTYYITAVFDGDESPSDKELVFLSEGEGSEESPYQITNVEQLQGIQELLSSHFILGNDIDASDTENWNEGEGFEPIGNFQGPFTGTLDGDGYIITNLTIDRPSQHFVGLFGFLRNNALISNLGIEDVDIKGHQLVGGLVGRNEGGEITSSYVNGGNIQGENSVGGLVAFNLSGEITSSYTAVNIIADGWDIGGLVGASVNNGIISNSYATGDVTGDANVGGLVGVINNSTVSSSYSAGAVIILSSDEPYGGFMGNNLGTITSSYWNTETSGREDGVGEGDSDGATGLTTSEMRQEASFAEWDFDDVWAIDEGESYPWLQVLEESGDENPTSVEDEGDSPLAFQLDQNYPNPFNPTTNISYQLQEASDIRIEVFDMLGRQVATLADGSAVAGTHTVTFDATRLASGMYIYRLTAGEFVQTQKMLLMK